MRDLVSSASLAVAVIAGCGAGPAVDGVAPLAPGARDAERLEADWLRLEAAAQRGAPKAIEALRAFVERNEGNRPGNPFERSAREWIAHLDPAPDPAVMSCVEAGSADPANRANPAPSASDTGLRALRRPHAAEVGRDWPSRREIAARGALRAVVALERFIARYAGRLRPFAYRTAATARADA